MDELKEQMWGGDESHASHWTPGTFYESDPETAAGDKAILATGNGLVWDHTAEYLVEDPQPLADDLARGNQVLQDALRTAVGPHLLLKNSPAVPLHQLSQTGAVKAAADIVHPDTTSNTSATAPAATAVHAVAVGAASTPASDASTVGGGSNQKAPAPSSSKNIAGSAGTTSSARTAAAAAATSSGAKQRPAKTLRKTVKMSRGGKAWAADVNSPSSSVIGLFGMWLFGAVGVAYVCMVRCVYDIAHQQYLLRGRSCRIACSRLCQKLSIPIVHD